MAIRDNRDHIRVLSPLIFLIDHYYRVGGPPNVSLSCSSRGLKG